jgi:hypothetical protein
MRMRTFVKIGGVRHASRLSGRLLVLLLIVFPLTGCAGGATEVADGPTSHFTTGDSSATTMQLSDHGDEAVFGGVMLFAQDGEITLEGVELVAPEGITVVNAGTHRPGRQVVGTATGWPPYPVDAMEPVEGAVLSSEGAPGTVQLLLGLQVDRDVDRGAFEGVNLRYRVGGRPYMMFAPHALEVDVAP